MFDSLKSLTKATIGVAIETPLAVAADFVTLGGSITERDEPYTTTAIKKVVKNVSDSTESDES
jgi:hypothetical protein